MIRKTWTLIIAGILTGGLGLHLVVTQPLQRQITTLTQEVNHLQDGMQTLADYRDDVSGTNDLLSGLQAQSRQISEARSALQNMRRLEEAVQIRSKSAADALGVLTEMTRLHSEVLAQNERIVAMHGTLAQLAQYQNRAERLAAAAGEQLTDIDQAEASLRQLGNFHQRVAIEASGIDVAGNRFGRLMELKSAIESVPPESIDAAQSQVSNLSGLTDQVIATGEQTARARQITGEFIALQDDIVMRGNRVDVARTHADQLLNLEDVLANDAGRDIAAAEANLAGLLQIEDQLASQDERLTAAVESLELLQDLQSEFTERTRELENIRRGLTELIMMESMVARTVRSLQPLTELTSLRRLNSEQLRSIARSMLDDEPARVASNAINSPVNQTSQRSDSEPVAADEELVPIPPVELLR